MSVPSIEAIIRELSSPDEGKRNATIEHLLLIGLPAVEPLIAALGTPDVAEYQVIVRALVSIGEPASEPLREALQSENRRIAQGAKQALSQIEMVSQMRRQLREQIAGSVRRKRKWRRSTLLRLGLVLPLLVCLYLWKVNRDAPFWAVWMILGIITEAFANVGGNLRSNAIATLTYARDVSMVGPIAVCLFDRDKWVRREAAVALKRLLPLVKADDKRYVQPDEMNALLKTLAGRDDLLRISILKALEQIGDEKALPYVERLIATSTSSPVSDAARECLPFLQLRAEQAQQAQTLLRASASSETASPETLLRPAQGIVSTDTSQLLRPR